MDDDTEDVRAENGTGILGQVALCCFDRVGEVDRGWARGHLKWVRDADDGVAEVVRVGDGGVVEGGSNEVHPAAAS